MVMEKKQDTLKRIAKSNTMNTTTYVLTNIEILTDVI
jgi:hypothetical protein